MKYITTHKQTPPTHNASPQTVTSNDLDVVIEGWERKFQHLSESIRDIQLASDKFNANMDSIVRDSRAREGAQERRIQEMHEGLTQFIERCDPAHLTVARRFESPVISTPFTPSEAPSRLRPDFDFESPVNQSAPTRQRATTEISATTGITTTTEIITTLEIAAEIIALMNVRRTRTTEGIVVTRSAATTTVG